jgi:tetratricopeptide (TPR) repeat protein
MRVHASLVWPYTELGMSEYASRAASLSLRLRTQVEAPEEVAGMYLNAARALLNDGEVAAALEALNNAEEIFRDLNWQTEISRAQTARGIVHLESGNYAQANRELTAALETFRRLGFVREEARTLNELARLERLLGNSQNGESLARQTLELVRQTEMLPTQARAHRELALCLGDSAPDLAEENFREAIGLYRQCGELAHAADTHRLLGDLLERQRASGGAAEYRAGLLLVAATWSDPIDSLDIVEAPGLKGPRH